MYYRSVLFVSLVAITSIISFAGSVSAAGKSTILVEDSFALNGTSRLPGTDLNGQDPEQQNGASSWQADYARFSKDGSITGAVNNDGVFPASARIGIAPLPSEIITITVETVVKTSDWVAVGFSGNKGSSSLIESGLLWVLLRPSGEWTIFADKTSTEIASGKLTDFMPDEKCTLGLSWDPDAKLLRAFVITHGETHLLGATEKDWISTDAVDAGTAKSAGFHINSNASTISGEARVDRFAVTSEAPVK